MAITQTSTCVISRALVGFYLQLGWHSDPGFLSVVIVGVVLTVGGSVATNVFRQKKLYFVRELDRLATKTPICSKCGRELRQEGLSFCPYCGSPLIWQPKTRAPPQPLL